MRNIQLGVFGVPLSAAYMLVKDGRALRAGGFLQGFDASAWLVVALQVGGRAGGRAAGRVGGRVGGWAMGGWVGVTTWERQGEQNGHLGTKRSGRIGAGVQAPAGRHCVCMGSSGCPEGLARPQRCWGARAAAAEGAVRREIGHAVHAVCALQVFGGLVTGMVVKFCDK